MRVNNILPRRFVIACLLIVTVLVVSSNGRLALAQSAEASEISVENLHVSLLFAEDEVQVHELYTFAETAVSSTTLTAIESSALAALPGGAVEPSVRQSGAPSALTMMVTYRLPYQNGLIFTHDIPFDVENVTFSLPHNGVGFAAAGWHQYASHTNSAGNITRLYQHSALAAGDRLTLELDGTPLLPDAGSPVSINSWLIALAGLGIIMTLIYIGAAQRKTAVFQAAKTADHSQKQAKASAVPGSIV